MLQDVMKNISKMPQIEFPLYSFVSDNMIFDFYRYTLIYDSL